MDENDIDYEEIELENEIEKKFDAYLRIGEKVYRKMIEGGVYDRIKTIEREAREKKAKEDGEKEEIPPFPLEDYIQVKIPLINKIMPDIMSAFEILILSILARIFLGWCSVDVLSFWKVLSGVVILKIYNSSMSRGGMLYRCYLSFAQRRMWNRKGMGMIRTFGR